MRLNENENERTRQVRFEEGNEKLDVRGLNSPMSLISSQSSRGRRTSSSRRSSPVDLVRLLLPSRLHIVDLLDPHVDWIPSVRVSLGGREVVMTRDEDIAESETLGWREHRVESVDRPPIREEVSLIHVSPGMVAVVVAIVDSDGEDEVLVLCFLSDSSDGEVVDGDLTLLERVSNGSEETTSLGVGRTGSSEGFPDGSSVSSPIGDELSSEDGFDSLCEERKRS